MISQAAGNELMSATLRNTPIVPAPQREFMSVPNQSGPTKTTATNDHSSDPLCWGDLASAKLIWVKGFLLGLLGCLASGILIIRVANLTDAALLCISVWAFCRAYYFAFYVIQHYVDPSYRFDGILSFVAYAIGRRNDVSSAGDQD